MSRAAVPAGTVRIGKGGQARLSPDLFVGNRLEIIGFDPRKKRLQLRFHEGDWGIKVFKGAPGARSGSAWLMAVLKLYGLLPAIGGTFRAVLRGKDLVIDFKRRLYDGAPVRAI